MSRKLRLVIPAALALCIILTMQAFPIESNSIEKAQAYFAKGNHNRALKVLDEYIKKNPEDSNAYFECYKIYYDLEKLDEAEASLDFAARHDPTNMRYIWALGDLLVQKGNYDVALSLYQRILLTSKEFSPNLYYRISSTYFKLGKYDDAENAVNTVLSRYPNNSKFLVLKGDILLAQNKVDEAVENYEKARRLGCNSKELLYSLAGTYQDCNNPENAIQKYKDILRIYPGETKPYKELSKIYRQQKNKAESIRAWVLYNIAGIPFNLIVWFLLGFGIFFFFFMYAFRFFNSILLLPFILIATVSRKKAWLELISRLASIYALDYIVLLANLSIISFEPDSADAWIIAGLYYERRSKLDTAHRYYKNAVTIDPERADAWFSLGVVLHRKSEFKQAEIAIKKSLEIEENNFIFWYQLGLSYFRQEMFPESMGAARQSLEISPDFAPAIDLFVESCESTGKIEECENTLLELISKNPVNVKGLMELGNILLSSGRPLDSLKYFDQAIAIFPESYEAWYNLGVAQRESGLLNNAAHSIKRAIELSPRSSWIHTSFSLTQIKIKQLPDAEKTLKKAIELDPLSSYSYYLMGVILREKKPGKSKKFFKKAIECFGQDLRNITKPWHKANEYECIAISYQMTGYKKKAKEYFHKAMKYAKVTPENLRIFSEEQLCLTTPKEFISECVRKINSVEPEVSVEFSVDKETT